jgi:hypothetical protein
MLQDSVGANYPQLRTAGGDLVVGRRDEAAHRGRDVARGRSRQRGDWLLTPG